MSPHPLDRPVVLATFYSVSEAELACANLVGAGIDARVEGQHAVGVLPMHAIALGGVRVVVGATDIERAKELLAAASQSDANGEASSEAIDSEHTEDAGDPWMRQAVFAGFLGMCMCPLVGTVYSLILLIRYSSLPRSHRGDMHRRLAIAFDVLAMFAVVAWRLTTVRGISGSLSR